MRFIALVLACGHVAACSSMPDVRITYYPPVAHTRIVVTESLDCDKTQENVFAVATVADPAIVYRADVAHPRSLVLKDFDGALSDTSVVATLAEDGRLKGLNATSTGQGEAILKSAITLVSPFLGRVGPGIKATNPACTIISRWGKDKPVTVTMVAEFNSTALPVGDVAFRPLPENDPVYAQLAAANVRSLNVVLHLGPPQTMKVIVGNVSSGDVPLTLNRTATVPLQVSVDGSAVWNRDILVPSTETYQLPIPRAAVFGKQVFQVVLSDAGAVTTIGYQKDSGVAGALNVGSALETALRPPSAAEQAAAVRAQADLIAAQQRLVRCRANPAACV